MSPRNVPLAEAFLQGYRLQIVTGSRYLEGFVGTKAAQDLWMGKKMEGWRTLVTTLAMVERQHLQTLYAGLQKSLQQE